MKTRYFTHTEEFGDDTIFVVFRTPKFCRAISKKGKSSSPIIDISLRRALSYARMHFWKEITKEQANELK